MSRLESFKLILALLVTLSISRNSSAESVYISGQKFKSYDDISDSLYGIFGNHMSNAITAMTLSELELTKLNGKFAFLSPSVETWKESYVWVFGSLIKPSADTQNMIGYSEQIQSEMIFHYFEKMGLVDRIDIVNESGFTKDVERNYDYVVTIRSEISRKRDAKSVHKRRTEFFVRNVNTGKEQKITETVGSPVLAGFFRSVAVKFSDAVKATN
jgi:hypothetical protein